MSWLKAVATEKGPGLQDSHCRTPGPGALPCCVMALGLEQSLTVSQTLG